MTQLMKKMIAATLIAGLMITMLPVAVNAGTTDKCRKEGCNRSSGSNGTIYCDYHASEYAREKGYKVCAVSGCYDQAQSKGSYCSKHTCRERNCYSKSVTGNWGYCSTHDPSKKKSSSTTTTKRSTSSYKKSSSSSTKKKYDTYHVYDYDSAQAFADDKYEEFYDYEDDYEDEDEAYDAAEDYWRDHH